MCIFKGWLIVMNTEDLERRLQEITYWCKCFNTEPDKKEAVSYLYVHTQLLLDELQSKKPANQVPSKM